jgi:ureidoglycolate lyase
VAGLIATADGRRALRPIPLDAAAFAPFGEVIDRGDLRATRAINAGTAARLDDLARIDASLHGAHVGIGLVRATPRALPFALQCIERHLEGTQAFIPLEASRWIIVVGAAGRPPAVDDLRAFIASGRQGVNYARGTWHHPLLVIDRAAEFLVVDRIPEDGREDCEVLDLSPQDIWLEVPVALNGAHHRNRATRPLGYRIGNTGIDYVHHSSRAGRDRT